MTDTRDDNHTTGSGGSGTNEPSQPDEPDATNDTTPTAEADDEHAASTAEVETRPTDRSTEGPDLSSPEYYLNRELSELEFHRRVLHESQDDRNPLLERVRFLAIVTGNIDEFVRKRIGGLKQQIEAGVTDRSPDGRTPTEQWVEALATTRELLREQTACYHEEIRPALAAEGIRLVEYDELGTEERSHLREYFKTSVMPMLTPLTFDPSHPFPFISNQSLSLAVLTRADGRREPKFSRVKIPATRPRLIPVEEGSRYMLLERLVAANLDLLFPGVEVVDHAAFRVTRNAEVGRSEEVAEDLIETIEDVLREREFAMAVRLEVESGMPEIARKILVEQLDLDTREVFELDGPLDFSDFSTLVDLDRRSLKPDPWTPQPHPRFESLETTATDAMFAEIRRQDILLHHPYHSFTDTVQRFLDAAAIDPAVHALKITIYRTATDSKVIDSLIQAARNGKQVVVMVELKARFDERNNIEWAEKLEDEGIHVTYGTLDLKTHTKTALVVREEATGMSLYSHIGTGNYHSETAKGYTDLGLLTADSAIGRDLLHVFNSFTGHSDESAYEKLLIAPDNLRDDIIALIRQEATNASEGGTGRIIAKMNRLEDPAIIEELYRASRAGVEIDLLIRDICRLRPGIEGVSENIRVSSIVGQFLEHSRIFRFRNGGDWQCFIGSADWMTRNLDSRVEVVAPIEDPSICNYLREITEVGLADNRRRWKMRADGSYVQCRPGDEPIRSLQQTFMNRVVE
ncbi:polyphosphate kinase 1 [Halorubrum vacuolatum]|uniref:Polyphosphate kinase n=1 Tax=Halorubrum vacuolatum TaxID=63740 RepID=A0A238XYA0_HALVU|nr:polyphosphate kinase 1 [Halorubrum vacuolatum]SNR63680.1 polyphosphate kinase [Halorubrum vacuolatum]